MRTFSKSKYNAIKTNIDGIIFDSKREAERYKNLKLEQAVGTITDLCLQPVFLLSVNGQKICKYRGDFSYIRDGKKIIEDVKGVKTPVYRLKKKLMKAIHGIAIFET